MRLGEERREVVPRRRQALVIAGEEPRTGEGRLAHVEGLVGEALLVPQLSGSVHAVSVVG